MRRVRYLAAVSLDGFIAGPKGEADWIIADPDIDFHGIFRQFDTFLIGRRTYEEMVKRGRKNIPGGTNYVFSRTLSQGDHPGVTIVSDGGEQLVAGLRAGNGKDIWVFGGGSLFGSLAGAGLVDTVEVSIIPVLLGEGVPLLFPGARRIRLVLAGYRTYKTGIVSLVYEIAERMGPEEKARNGGRMNQQKKPRTSGARRRS